MGNMFDIMFIIMPILVFLIFGFVIAMMISPKLKGKLMARQLMSTKYMLDDIGDDLASMVVKANNISIDAKKRILDENEDDLKDINIREAETLKDSIYIKTKAFSEGVSNNNIIYCKHCGVFIDSDSKFCKKCGKEQ